MPHESSTICHLPYAVSQLPRAQWYRKHGSVTVSLPLLFGTHSFLAVLWQGSVSCLIQVAYTLSCFLRSDSEKLEYSFKQPPKLNVFSFEDTYLRLNSLNFRGKKERERNLMSFSLRLWVFWICWLGCGFFCLFCFLFFTMSVACGHSRVRNQTRATWATAVTTWQHLILNALHHQGTLGRGFSKCLHTPRWNASPWSFLVWNPTLLTQGRWWMILWSSSLHCFIF